MTSKGIVVVACVLFGGAVYGLHNDKMRVTTVCRDARIYMDGGINTNIESGGINLHRTLKIFRQNLRKQVFLGEFNISNENSEVTPDVESYSGSNFKLTIAKNEERTKYGFPAHLDAVIGKEKISVGLLCSQK